MNPVPPGSYTLRELKEVALPDPVSWWPQTTGWYLLLLLGLVGAGYFVWRWVRLWWHERYRREAIDALTRLSPDDKQWPQQMMKIIKAVMVYLDAQNAPLYGQSLLSRMSHYQPGEHSLQNCVLFNQWVRCLEDPHAIVPDYVALHAALTAWISEHRIVESAA